MHRFITILLCVTAGVANGQTLTASCKDPTGRALGVLGKLGSNRPIDAADSMQGGVVTLSWKIGQSTASIVTNTGTANSVSSTEGVLIFSTQEQVSFVATYPGAAYMYSVFPHAKKMLIASHQLFLGMDSGSAVSKAFSASCDVSTQ